VSDVVAAARAAAQRARGTGGVFNIGGGSQTSVGALLRLVGELAGEPLDIRYRERARGDVRDTAADCTRARIELGFEPLTDLDQGVAAQLDWMRRALVAQEPGRSARPPSVSPARSR
jgi:nucleoside-diphosphate-sugar epimerase